MNCPKCGTRIVENAKFCRNCGYNLQNTNYNYNLNNTHQSQDDYSFNYSYTNAKDLKEIYVGNNYETIKKEGFNVCALLFGMYYLFYRKMWLYGISWLILAIICGFFLANYAYFLSIGLGIVAGIKFNSLYLRQVEENIEKIKQENLDKSTTELESICKKKGGTSVAAAILPIFIIVVASVIYATVLVYNKEQNVITNNQTITNNTNYDNDISSDTTIKNEKIYSLSYSVPSKYTTGDYNTETYKSYSYITTGQYCNITINSYASSLYNDASEYLSKNLFPSSKDTETDMIVQNINNENWQNKGVISSSRLIYMSAIIKNERVYAVKYSIYNDKNQTCKKDYNDLINSLKFN